MCSSVTWCRQGIHNILRHTADSINFAHPARIPVLLAVVSKTSPTISAEISQSDRSLITPSFCATPVALGMIGTPNNLISKNIL